MIETGIYTGLEEIVGADYVSREPAVLDSYVWQSLPGEDPDIWLKRPAAVVLPGSIEEMQAVVTLCGRNGLRCSSYATGWGAFGAPMSDDVVQLDLNRMNRILSIDAEKRVAIVEPGVCAAQLQAEAMKLGLNVRMPQDGPCGSHLWEGGSDKEASGGNEELLAAEYVLPDGEISSMSDIAAGIPDRAIVVRGTVRLQEWPGPSEIKIDGLLFDAKAEVPDSTRFYICFFPDSDSEERAGETLESEHVGYLSNYASFGSLVYCLVPNLFAKVAETEVLGDLMRKVLSNTCVIMLASASPEDLDRQEGSLKSIVGRAGGVVVETRRAPRLASLLLASHFRSAVVPRAGRGWGAASTFLERLEV